MLAQMGERAFPALIDALDDMDPIRTVLLNPVELEKSYAFRVCDAAALIIEHLSVYTFNLSGRSLSQSSAEERRKMIRHIQGWWAQHKGQTRREWLLPRIEAGDTTALRGLVEAAGSQAVPLLRRLLHHRDPLLRVEAAALLGDVQGEEGKAALRSLLKDPDPDARDAAVWRVMEKGKKEAFPHLLPLLKDPDPTVRAGVAEALEGLPAVVPYLIPLLDDHARTNLPEIDTSTGRRFRLKVCHVVSRAITHTTNQNLDEGLGIREDLLDRRMDRLKAWWEKEGKSRYPRRPPE
jgi:HEAT repeat protein